MLCCERMSGLTWQKGQSNSDDYSAQQWWTEAHLRISQHIKTWGRWAATAGGHIGFHFHQLRSESWSEAAVGTGSQLDTQKLERAKPGQMGLELCWLLNDADGWVTIWHKEHESMNPPCLVSTGWGWWRRSGECCTVQHTLSLLIQINNLSNATPHLSSADHAIVSWPQLAQSPVVTSRIIKPSQTGFMIIKMTSQYSATPFQ